MSEFWQGPPVPGIDDFNRPITDEFVDGNTIAGVWAMLNPESHRVYGVGRVGAAVASVAFGA